MMGLSKAGSAAGLPLVGQRVVALLMRPEDEPIAAICSLYFQVEGKRR